MEAPNLKYLHKNKDFFILIGLSIRCFEQKNLAEEEPDFIEEFLVVLKDREKYCVEEVEVVVID